MVILISFTCSNDLSNVCSELTAACKTFPRVATVLFKFLYLELKFLIVYQKFTKSQSEFIWFKYWSNGFN